MAADKTSINTNGTRVLLRIGCGKSRRQLAGDLNQKAHHELLALYHGRETEFACEVGKCCHHGSEDVSLEFLNHMKAACAVISSGDAEGHDHPRPRIVAASGVAGLASIKGDRIETPRVYSTELARSIELGQPDKITTGSGTAAQCFSGAGLKDVRVDCTTVTPGAFRAARGGTTMDRTVVKHELPCGLVNIRSDGRRVHAIKNFHARF